ncbi:glycosyl transferase (plasmid) [Novosphingobium sp. PP1Y]|nr:glycosyl transferase [Novosphingobium sp. PP1Y]
MNVSTSADWCRRPVGIIRVEREISKAVYSYCSERLIPVYLDRTHDRWMKVDDSCFQDIMSDSWVSSLEPDKKAASVFKHLQPFTPMNDDQFVTVGSDWSFNIPDRVEKLYGSSRVMVAACYDLIPLLFPEFTPGMEFFEQFNHHYRAVARMAQSVFAISEVSAKSLRDFWDKEGLAHTAPPVEVVPLAAPAPTFSEFDLDDKDFAMLDEIERKGPYVIYVSTIEPRKNHQLLLDIWRELFAERGEKCPTLLIVGMRGWGSEDMIRSAQRMQASKAGKIVWREGLSDALLAQLYSRSAFAVFPSYFEGWGLAATEAAALGKVCVVSSTGALVEATQGKMPSYHPLDFIGWKQELIRLLDDAGYRRSLEKGLDTQLFRRTWQDFGKEFCTTFLGAR